MHCKLLAATAVLLLHCIWSVNGCSRKPAAVQVTPVSEWTQWGECTTKCGSGIQTRWRKLLTGNGGSYCEKRSCFMQSGCNDIYEWSKWSEWFSCSSSCGGGVQSRNRSCSQQEHHISSKFESIAVKSIVKVSADAAVSSSASSCVGIATESRDCNTEPCPTQPPVYNWTTWSEWSPCSASCNGGAQQRNRSCQLIGGAAVPPANDSCSGSDTELRACAEFPCPTTAPQAQWTAWSGWSACSTTCAVEGIQMSSRSCRWLNADIDNKPVCDGASSRNRVCKPDLPCPVLPTWQQWSEWSTCSVTCGNGQSRRSRSRSCSQQQQQQPSPDPTAAPCKPPPESDRQQQQQRNCSESACPPVDGNWSGWTQWSSCLATCGYGYRTRIRFCDNPSPRFGGRNCSGESFNHERCLGGECPVDGRWSKWEPCSDCITQPLHLCKEGRKKFCRSCSDPKPMFGGTVCPHGAAAEWRDCWNLPKCENTSVQEPMSFRLIGFPNSTDVLGRWQRAPFGWPATAFLLNWKVNDDASEEAWIDVVPPDQQEELGEEYQYWFKGYAAGSKLIIAMLTQGIRPNGRSAISTPIRDEIIVSQVHGEWGQWGQFSQCKSSGGCREPGQYTRRRLCNDPAPVNGGDPCPGSDQETSTCFVPC